MVTCRPARGYTSPREAQTLISPWFNNEGGQSHKLKAFLRLQCIIPDDSFGSPVKQLIKNLTIFFHNQTVANVKGQWKPNPKEDYDLFLKYIDISIRETNGIPSCEGESAQPAGCNMDPPDNIPGDHATRGQLLRSGHVKTGPTQDTWQTFHCLMRETGLKVAQNQPQTYP